MTHSSETKSTNNSKRKHQLSKQLSNSLTYLLRNFCCFGLKRKRVQHQIEAKPPGIAPNPTQTYFVFQDHH